MTKFNPYATSNAVLKGLGPTNGVRRIGNLVAMPLEAALPNRCVKCNGEAHEPTPMRTLYWYPSWCYVFIFIPLLLIIVALVARKEAYVTPGLCRDHKRKRTGVITTAWVGLFVAFTVPFMFANTGYLWPAVWFSILLFLGVIGYAILRGRLVYATRIDQYEVLLAGCGDDYLDSLPGN